MLGASLNQLVFRNPNLVSKTKPALLFFFLLFTALPSYKAEPEPEVGKWSLQFPPNRK